MMKRVYIPRPSLRQLRLDPFAASCVSGCFVLCTPVRQIIAFVREDVAQDGPAAINARRVADVVQATTTPARLIGQGGNPHAAFGKPEIVSLHNQFRVRAVGKCGAHVSDRAPQNPLVIGRFGGREDAVPLGAKLVTAGKFCPGAFRVGEIEEITFAGAIAASGCSRAADNQKGY